MIISVAPNHKQLDDVEVSLTMTMRLSEWKLISDALRKDGQTNYHWSKTSMAHAIEGQFDKFHKVLVEEVKP